MQVTLYLDTADEMRRVADFIEQLEADRERRDGGLPAATEPVVNEPDARVEAAEPADVVVVSEPAARVVAAPVALAAAYGAEPTESELVAAIRAYATREGLPAATAMLAKYGAKRVPDVATERRAAFLAELTAGAA